MNYLQRKKKAFMSILNGVKGFVRSISGIPPITLEDCVDEKSVINYQIFGNSVQDGEPTPDNPVDVVSVGEKTKNLVNPKAIFNTTTKVIGLTVTYNNDGSFNLIGTATQTYTFVNTGKNIVSISSGQTVVAVTTYDCDISAPQIGLVMRIGNTQKSVIGGKSGISEKLTLTSDIDNIGLRLTNFTVGTYYEIRNIRIMLEEGETATEYEPYGYKIPVTATSETGESVTTNIYLNEPLTKDWYIDFKSQKSIEVNGEETEKNIELPALPTFKGTTIYEIDTTVQPSNMVVDYYSTTKGE